MAIESEEHWIHHSHRAWVNGKSISGNEYDRVRYSRDAINLKIVSASVRNFAGKYEGLNDPFVVEVEPDQPKTPQSDTLPPQDLFTEPANWSATREWTAAMVAPIDKVYTDIQDKPHLIDTVPRSEELSFEDGQDLQQKGIKFLDLGLSDCYIVDQIVAIIRNRSLGTATIFWKLWRGVPGEIRFSTYPLERMESCSYAKDGDEAA